MSDVQVVKMQFTTDSGEIRPYNVLRVSGSVNGLEQSLDIKLSKSEALAVGMILNSDEKLNVVKSQSSNNEPTINRTNQVSPDDPNAFINY